MKRSLCPRREVRFPFASVDDSIERIMLLPSKFPLFFRSKNTSWFSFSRILAARKSFSRSDVIRRYCKARIRRHNAKSPMKNPLRDAEKQCAKRCAVGEKMGVSFHLRAIPATTEKVTCAGFIYGTELKTLYSVPCKNIRRKRRVFSFLEQIKKDSTTISNFIDFVTKI